MKYFIVLYFIVFYFFNSYRNILNKFQKFSKITNMIRELMESCIEELKVTKKKYINNNSIINKYNFNFTDTIFKDYLFENIFYNSRNSSINNRISIDHILNMNESDLFSPDEKYLLINFIIFNGERIINVIKNEFENQSNIIKDVKNCIQNNNVNYNELNVVGVKNKLNVRDSEKEKCKNDKTIIDDDDSDDKSVKTDNITLKIEKPEDYEMNMYDTKSGNKVLQKEERISSARSSISKERRESLYTNIVPIMNQNSQKNKNDNKAELFINRFNDNDGDNGSDDSSSVDDNEYVDVSSLSYRSRKKYMETLKNKYIELMKDNNISTLISSENNDSNNDSDTNEKVNINQKDSNNDNNTNVEVNIHQKYYDNKDTNCSETNLPVIENKMNENKSENNNNNKMIIGNDKTIIRNNSKSNDENDESVNNNILNDSEIKSEINIKNETVDNNININNSDNNNNNNEQIDDIPTITIDDPTTTKDNDSNNNNYYDNDSNNTNDLNCPSKNKSICFMENSNEKKIEIKVIHKNNINNKKILCRMGGQVSHVELIDDDSPEKMEQFFNIIDKYKKNEDPFLIENEDSSLIEKEGTFIKPKGQASCSYGSNNNILKKEEYQNYKKHIVDKVFKKLKEEETKNEELINSSNNSSSSSIDLYSFRQKQKSLVESLYDQQNNLQFEKTMVANTIFQIGKNISNFNDNEEINRVRKENISSPEYNQYYDEMYEYENEAATKKTHNGKLYVNSERPSLSMTPTIKEKEYINRCKSASIVRKKWDNIIKDISKRPMSTTGRIGTNKSGSSRPSSSKVIREQSKIRTLTRKNTNQSNIMPSSSSTVNLLENPKVLRRCQSAHPVLNNNNIMTTSTNKSNISNLQNTLILTPVKLNDHEQLNNYMNSRIESIKYSNNIRKKNRSLSNTNISINITKPEQKLDKNKDNLFKKKFITNINIK